jgi:peptidoglycan/LPS O-acetylase OafA/YrhL
VTAIVPAMGERVAGVATAESEFRPDLEGLRAVAVVLVLLYHAAIPGFPGGFIGVDVFFVLSGFLITRLLVRELASTGRVSLPAFYARRARRLLPAAAATLLVTAGLSALLLPPLRLGDVGGDIAAAAAYVSNLRFAFLATDYLGSELPPSPVLHFWSLGVEEQFYLFWPAILVVTSAPIFASGEIAHGMRRVTLVLGAVLVGSAAISVWLTVVAQPWAFFSLPARAWELALGGLLAMPPVASRIRLGAAPFLGWVGLVLVLASGVLITEATPFPGTAAFLPTIGSALVIASGLAIRGDQPPSRLWPEHLLSLPPMRFLGRISYSLYLWHWPILVLPAAALGPLPWVARVGLSLLAVAVAAASQRWIEDPIRHGRVVGTRPRRVLALAGALTIVVATSALSLDSFAEARARPTGPVVGGDLDTVPLPSATATLGNRAALPSPSGGPLPADLAPALAQAKDDLPVIYSDGCHLDIATTTPGDCIFGDTTSSTTVVLFGDSHAAQWFPALERLSRAHHWRLLSMTKSACAPADIPVWNGVLKHGYDECRTWREAVLARVAREHPAFVVVSEAYNYTLDIDGDKVSASDREDIWKAGLERTLQRIADVGAVPVLIGDTPRMGDDPPDCLSEHVDDVARCTTTAAVAVDRHGLSRDRKVAEEVGATFVDPTSWVCFTDPCIAVNGRFLVFRDTHHLTATYARGLAPRLYPLLPPTP